MNKRSSISLGTPSKRQAQVLEFVAGFQRKHDYAPSLSEIAKHFRVSVPTIHQHVSYLRGKNLLTTEKGKSRSIQVPNDHKNGMTKILLMGLIAAGGPIEAIRDPRPIEVPRNMLPAGADYYALKIAGTSMIDDGIFDGDIVIVSDQQSVDDGDKAVVYLPERDAVTLKRVYRENGRTKLVPANPKMKPFYETNVEIQGKVVGVLRKEN